MLYGNVFNVQRFSVHDGPGIRTTVFFKGCPLQCAWCHNPESISFSCDHIHYADKCIECGECNAACPTSQGHLTKDKKLVVNSGCTGCGTCQETCLLEARELVGRQKTVDELMNVVLKDSMFYEESGGGVTLSGGEILAQHEFVLDFAKGLKNKGIHVTLDTSGFGKTEALKELAAVVDLILYDLKVMDEAAHLEHTGVSNQLILDNLRMLEDQNVEVQIRMPLIENLSATNENIESMMVFLEKSRFKNIAILPFHNIGCSKYNRLGLEESMNKYEAPSSERMSEIAGLFTKKGYKVQIGG